WSRHVQSVLHETLLPTFVVVVPVWMRSDQDQGGLPGRLPGAHQTGGITARCPGEGTVTGCHVTAPTFVAAVWIIGRWCPLRRRPGRRWVVVPSNYLVEQAI